MSLHFNSVEQILTQLETQPGWEKFREHRQLLKCWERVIDRQIAQHTRPLYINRQVLYIATSSAARAQELSFQRYTLLKRLNQRLTTKVQDIHFSSSQWHQQTDRYARQETQASFFIISDRQKSKISSDLSINLKQDNKAGKTDNYDNDLSPQARAKNAAQRWLRTIEQRAAASLVCPQCNSLTSQAELNRWNLCHHCVAQKWSEKYCPSVFSEHK
jgi:predicted nucleic acid-binding Zn ribbon protein